MIDKMINVAVDPTMGRLAKWLRIMGIDAHYQHEYRFGEIELMLKAGRTLITRNSILHSSHEPSILIISEKIESQLMELKKCGFLPETSDSWFKRCTVCNIPLQSAKIIHARGRIPEYVISQNTKEIKYCPSCERYFWPGSHRKKILKQMKQWGLF